MNDQVRFAKKRDIQSIQKYIKKNWSKNHIFTKDENLFLWQHKHIDEKKLNFVIAINKNDQICGLMGFITSNFTKFNIGVWTAIWHVNKKLCNNKNTGIKLLNFILDRFKPSIISGTTLGSDVKNLYKLLGFKIILADHFFLPAVKKSDIFFSQKKIKIDNNIDSKSYKIFLTEKITYELDKSNNLIENMNDKNYNYTLSLKDNRYIIHRYHSHPKYKYLLLVIEKDEKTICQLVVRNNKVDNKNVLRIVDIIYLNLTIDSSLYSNIITKFIINNKYEYIDFLSALKSNSLAEKLGFYKKIESDLIPNNFEPFQKKNFQNIIAYKLSNEREYFFFKGDGDSDRPNQ